MASETPVELLVLLQRHGTLNASQVSSALASFDQWGGLMVEHVCRATGLTPGVVASAIAAEMELPLVTAQALMAAPSGLHVHVPEAVARQHRVVPFELTPTVLKVAFHDPMAWHCGWPPPAFSSGVEWHVGPAPEVEMALARAYPVTLPRATAPLPPSVEVPNQDFAEALGLGPTRAPVLLLKKKPSGEPQLLSKRKADSPRLASLGAAAEKMFAADKLPKLAAVAVGYLSNFFPRVAVLDLGSKPAAVLAVHGFSPLAHVQVDHLPGLDVILEQVSPYYGDAVQDPQWDALRHELGGEPPRFMLVLPVRQKETARLMIYADQTHAERYADLHEFEQLGREMGQALETSGL